jgi:hypothetical protein
MRRQCARPGCSAVATTTFTFDSHKRTVWLDPPEEGAARAGELCPRHTRALAPPLGWRVVDRRETPSATPAPIATVAPNPEIVAEETRVVAAAPVATLAPPPAPFEAPRLDFDTLASAAPVPPVAPAPVAWYPRFERGDSLDGVLEATTPLLARAFGNVRAI